MPSRWIRAEINSSESLSRVSIEAELTFRALLLAVDDYGRFDARPAILKGILFPMRRDVTLAKLARWMGELAHEGCVVLYEVEGRAYLGLPNWELYRRGDRRAKASKYPDRPPIEPVDCKQADLFGKDALHGNPPISARTRANVPSVNPESGGGGRAREGGGVSFAPADLDEGGQVEVLAWAGRKYPEIPEGMVVDLVEACLDYFRGSGGKKRDWPATAKTWIRREMARDREKGGGDGGKRSVIGAARRIARRRGL